MRRAYTKRTFKLRLLAFVLASALAWYSVNPAPRPFTRIRREDELPDEWKRELEPGLHGAAISPVALGTSGTALEQTPLPDQDEDDFEWPDFIDG
ncbi:MAG TPA: hypothetical protein VF735_16405 [Pyrinomonadaceae bacterium]|jgi:hypothetical protein